MDSVKCLLSMNYNAPKCFLFQISTNATAILVRMEQRVPMTSMVTTAAVKLDTVASSVRLV